MRPPHAFASPLSLGPHVHLHTLNPLSPPALAPPQVPGAHKVPFSDVYGKPRVNLFFNREYTTKDKIYLGFMAFVHGGALLAPFTFRCVEGC